MLSAEKTLDPLPALAVVFGAAGGAKLAGAGSIKTNFARWGYPAWSRLVVGAVEVTIAASALRGTTDAGARKLAGAGALLTMAGAIATHARAGDAPQNFIAPVVLGVLGVAALADLTLTVTP
jgi:hypothetical protein